jgi:AhpD family alkylhydroperoxidase
MTNTLFPSSTDLLRHARKQLTPEIHDAFQAFQQRVFTNGALATKTKQLIAVAVAHVTQCPYCIRGHTKAAMREGVTRDELMEAIWVAAEMRAGAAYAHSVLALDEMEKARPSPVTDNTAVKGR